MFLGFLRLKQFNNWPRLPSIRHATIRFLRFFFTLLFGKSPKLVTAKFYSQKENVICMKLLAIISSDLLTIHPSIHHGLMPDGVPATIDRSNDWPSGQWPPAFTTVLKEKLRLRILYSFCCGSKEVLTDANWDLGVILFSGLFLVDSDNDEQLSKTKIWWLTLIILSA